MQLFHTIKKEVEMPDSIDVRELPDEQVRMLEKWVRHLKARARKRKTHEEEEVAFATWPLGVKGKVTREEIYDYL